MPAILGGFFILVAAPEASRAATLQAADVCAADYLVALARPGDRLLAPPEALDPWAPTAGAALEPRGVDAERLLTHPPSLLVATYGPGRRVTEMARRLGVPVLILSGHGVVGIADNLMRLAGRLGRSREAEALLDAIPEVVPEGLRPRALYVTAGGATAGPGTSMDEVMRLAGFINAAPGPGYPFIDPEWLLRATPDLLVTAFYDGTADRSAWDLGRSGPFQRVLARLPRIDLPASAVACEGPTLLSLAARLAAEWQALRQEGEGGR